MVLVHFFFYQSPLMLQVHLVWKPVWSIHSAFFFLVYLLTSSFFGDWTTWFCTTLNFHFLTKVFCFYHTPRKNIEREFLLLGVKVKSLYQNIEFFELRGQGGVFNQHIHLVPSTPPNFYSLPSRVHPRY